MLYSVRFVGDERKFKIDAASSWAAALEFAKLVPLPQTGWVVVEGEHIETFAVEKGILVNPLPQGSSLPTSPSVIPQVAEYSSNASCNVSSYPALKTISVLFKVLAVVMVISDIICGFVLADEMDMPVFAFLGFVAAFFSWLVLWGMSELFRVFVDIADNTRLTAQNTMKR